MLSRAIQLEEEKAHLKEEHQEEVGRLHRQLAQLQQQHKSGAVQCEGCGRMFVDGNTLTEHRRAFGH